MDKKINFTFISNDKLKTPVYIQLYEYIKGEIVKNTFMSGYKLPSIREASNLLSLSKTTIQNSYNQLLVEGYIENYAKKGYYVTDNINFDIPRKGDNNVPKDISENIVYLNNGVDTSSFSKDIWRKLYNKVISYDMTNIYTNSNPQGEYDLRLEISEFVNNIRGGKTTANQVIVGAGIQYLIGILSGMIKNEYNQVSFETPGYKKAEYIFQTYMFDINRLPLYETSFAVNDLLNSGSRLVYVSPSHQFPTGNTMPVNKRLELLKWANDVNGLIIEDDYDGIIRYDGNPIPCLQGLDTNDCVIYLGSFSKTLIPSLRISYMIIPKKLILAYEKIKNNYTQTTSKIEQIVLSQFIKEGYMTKHLRKIRRLYKKKNNIIISYMIEKYSDLVNIVNSDSGFHIVFEVKTNKSGSDIINDCKKNNIFIEIINHYPNKILLSMNYSGINTEQIELFIDKLMQSII